MKFIHLGDLHLGIKFHKRSLIEDQKYVLDQVVRLVEAERANVIIAGDVYDTVNPSIEAQMLWFDFIRDLSTIHSGQNTKTYVIAGNHDSASRLGLGSAFTQAHGVHIVSPTSLYEVFTLQEGWDTIQLLAIPFLKPQVIDVLEGTEFGDNYTSAFNYVKDKATQEFELDPTKTIIVAHQTFEGGNYGESEFKPFMDDAISNEVAAGYRALLCGHLHEAQTLTAKDNTPVVYSGSLLQYAFGDVYSQSIQLWEVTAKEITSKRIPIEVLHKVEVVEGDLAHVLTVDKPNSYVKVKLKDCVHLDEATAKLHDHFPLLLNIITDEAEKWEADLQKPIGTFTDFNEAITEFCKFQEIPIFTGKKKQLIEEAVHAFNQIED